MMFNPFRTLVAVALASAFAMAQEVKAVVFFDFTGKKPTSRLIVDSDDLAWKALHKAIKGATAAADDLYVIKLGLPMSPTEELKELTAALPTQADEASQRIVTEKGQSVEIFALIPGTKTVELNAKEDSRDTLLSQEFKILKGAIGALGVDGGDQNIYLVHKVHVLMKVRANVVVSATQNENEKEVAKAEVPIITGPSECFFLGATVNQKAVKFKDGGVTPSEAPKSLKVGLYYQPFGDVLSDYDDWSKPGNALASLVVIHLSGEFSSKPFSSGACGIGLKFPKIRGDLKFLSGLSLTRGVIWTEAERTVGTSKENYHQRDWVWMVGYDLLQVNRWFSK